MNGLLVAPTSSAVLMASSARPNASQEAIDAVQAVFDFGETATSEPIKYVYAPDKCASEWHESQDYVLTINGHKFFKEAR